VKTIGVLDLQGGVAEHLDHFARLGAPARRVKQAADFHDLAGLVIPGGESTCLMRLMRILGTDEAILAAHRGGAKLWGTCAGAILLASRVVGEDPKLGLMDIEIERNAFGSQLDSFACTAVIPCVADEEIPLTFIRAPKILRAGPGVTILHRQAGAIAMAETADVLVTTFHPELTPCLAFHRYFARKCGLQPPEPRAGTDPSWSRASWTRQAPIT